MQTLFNILRWIWNHLVILAAAIWPTRVALGLIIAAWIILFYNDQGQDIAIRLAQSATFDWRWLIFFAATAWWSVQSWLWSRIALDQHFPPASGQDRLPVRLPGGTTYHSRMLYLMVGGLPRIYALLVFLLAAVAVLRAANWSGSAGWVFLISGIALALFLWFRRRLIDPLRLQLAGGSAARANATHFQKLRAGAAALVTPGNLLVGWRPGATPIARFLTGASLALAILTCLAVWFWPGAQWVGTTLGSASGSFFAFAAMLAALGLASIWSRKLELPVVSILLILGAAVSLAPSNVLPTLADRHEIPVVSKSLDQRRSLEVAWKAWQAANSEGAPGTPIVFLATAGGGVRATLWTSVVLDRARQVDEKFDKHLFAISGVSGGALGAMTYLSALSSGAAGAPGPCSDAAQNTGLCTYGRLGEKFSKADMLGPTLEAAFYGDLLFTFLPLPSFVTSADALTESWRVAWDKAAPGQPGAFGRPFLEHWKGDGWRPVLMLNGTQVESGKRLITTDLILETAPIRDAWDLHKIVNGDIDTAMAALNAARFPGVVAAGTVTTAAGERWGHVIDGGYFENSGALGLVELAEQLLWRTPTGRGLRPIFVEIVSDPQIVARDYERHDYNAEQQHLDDVGACGATSMPSPDGRKKCYTARPIDFLVGITGPAMGLLNVRSGHGVSTPKSFAGMAMAPAPDTQGIHVQFRLCPASEKSPEPLGWQLSDYSAADIIASLPAGDVEPEPKVEAGQEKSGKYQRWLCRKDNEKALQDLKAALTSAMPAGR